VGQDVGDWLVKSMLSLHRAVRSTLIGEEMIRDQFAVSSHVLKVSLKKASALLFASKRNMENKDGEIAR
jgi:hypothetical protein